MSGIELQPEERDIRRIVAAVKQLQEGRSNAVGLVTLRANQTTTVVSAPNCGKDSKIFLFPRTATAAAAMATTYVLDANVLAGSFTITHASTADVDKKLYWLAIG